MTFNIPWFSPISILNKPPDFNGCWNGSPKRWDRWHSPSPNWQEKYHLYTTYSPCLLGGYMLPIPPFTGTRNNHWRFSLISKLRSFPLDVLAHHFRQSVVAWLGLDLDGWLDDGPIGDMGGEMLSRGLWWGATYPPFKKINPTFPVVSHWKNDQRSILREVFNMTGWLGNETHTKKNTASSKRFRKLRDHVHIGRAFRKVLNAIKPSSPKVL